MMSDGPDTTVVGTCKAKIEAALSPKELEVTGAFDDPNGSHITVFCVSEKFEGKRSLARQQMVFKAIWEEMQGARACPRTPSNLTHPDLARLLPRQTRLARRRRYTLSTPWY